MRLGLSSMAERLRRRWRRWSEPWWRRLRRWAVPEVAVGSAIAVGWAMAATWTLGTPWLVAAVVATLAVQLGAVETGGHRFVWFLTAWILVLVLGAAVAHAGFPPLGYTVAALTVVAHTDTIRLAHSRRRSAHRDGRVVARTAAGWGAVAALSLATVAAIAPLANETGRAWWWLPTAAAALLVAAIGLAVGPTVRAPDPQRQRWRPGERLEPRRADPAGIDNPVGPGGRNR